MKFPTGKKCIAELAIFFFNRPTNLVGYEPTMLLKPSKQGFTAEFLLNIIINESRL